VSEHVLFLVLGLGTGAIYALLGLGLVMEHRSSGVVNFAHGAIATVIAYVFVELRSTGDLVLPWVGFSNRISLSNEGLALGPAIAVASLYAAVLGLVIYVVVFRPLRAAPALAKVVASVGLMLVLQSFVVIAFGTSAKSTSAVLPDEPVELFGQVVPRDRLWLAAVAVCAAALLWALFRYTRFGLATRAAAESEKGATLLGYSSTRIAAANWVLASMLAGVAGVLLAPITSLTPLQYSLLVVPALGVALVGRFRSFSLTALAAFALGMAQSEITKIQADHDWFPKYGVKEGLPFLVILVAMAAFGRSLPERGEAADTRPPATARPGSPLAPAVLGTSVALIALIVLQGSYRGALIQSLVAALLCLSLVVLTGYVGQISLAQMTFAGLSGLTLSRLALDVGVPFPLSMLLASLVAVAAGLLLGLPALRVRGVQLAVITIAAAVAVEQFVFANPDLNGGFTGAKVPPPSLFGLDLNIRSPRIDEYPRVAFGVFVLVVLVVVAIGVTNLRRNATGRRMLAVRANERAAAAAGIDVRATKLLAFGLSAFIAGIAGAIIGYQRGLVSAESFGVFASLTLLAFAYVGGIGRVSGAIAGGVLIAAGGLVPVALDRWLALGRYEVLLSGLGLVAIAIAHPDGVATAFDRPTRAVRGWWQRSTTRFAVARSAPPVRTHAARPPLQAPAEGPLLSVRSLSVSFGGINALDDIDLVVEHGSFVGLIGPNGAGKTTFVDAVSGYVRPVRGTIGFADGCIDRLRPHVRARRGLARTFQGVELFDDLTVVENVLVAAEPVRWWTSAADVVRHRPGRLDDALWALDIVGMRRSADLEPSALSHGQRKLVGIARAVASRPKLVLLDEPAAGLDTHESRTLGTHLRSLVAEGIGVLLIDHDMGLVLGACDEIWVLDFGRVLAHGSPDTIRADRAVIDAYLGDAHQDGAAAQPGVPAATTADR
jgi:ABC-type branched-subunit amino acid transport system ATPase component/ABC-type branched-subunit amino acid transport system permease subunit